MRIIRTVSISKEQNDSIDEQHLSPTEIFRVGLGMILAERGVKDYDSNLNLYRKMIGFRDIVQDLSTKLDKLVVKR